jgi:hypothetical protein
MMARTFDGGLVALGIAEQEGGGLAVERVARVGVEQQLREEHFEYVDEICAARVEQLKPVRSGQVRSSQQL